MSDELMKRRIKLDFRYIGVLWMIAAFCLFVGGRSDIAWHAITTAFVFLAANSICCYVDAVVRKGTYEQSETKNDR